MIKKKINESFNHTSLSPYDKKRIYENIIAQEAFSNENKNIIKHKDNVVNIVTLGRKSKVKKIVAACLVVALMSSVTVGVYAAYKWLNPSTVAYELDNDKLAASFNKIESELQIQESNEYRVIYFGVISGDDIGHEIGSNGEVVSDRTYVAVAIQRKDGTAMDKDKDEFFVSPLVQNLKPWQFNTFAMNGDVGKYVKEGTLYLIVACDNIEMFAKSKVYLAVQNGMTYNIDAYSYDESTGEVSRNKEYEDLNLLFDLELDKSKADPEAANAFIEKWNNENAEDNLNEEANEKNIPSTIKSSVVDKKDNLTCNIWDGTRFLGYSGDDEYGSSYYAIYPEIIGEGIDRITYSLDDVMFYKKIEVTQEEADAALLTDNSDYYDVMPKEYIGTEKLGDKSKPLWLLKEDKSSFTVNYGEQNTVDNVYAIGVTAKVTETDDVNSGYKALAKELSKRSIHVSIQYKDGHTVEKELVFSFNNTKAVSRMVTEEWK